MSPARPVPLARAVILVLALLGPAAEADLFSPGPLSKPHAGLEGIQNCAQCHKAGQQLSEEKCLTCHTEVAKTIREKTGYHGHLNAESRACENCHKEHEGRDNALINWVPSKKLFPHGDTGFPLNGKHAQLSCEKCHEERRLKPDMRAWLSAHPGVVETYLGLPSACVACHFDEHREQLGDECQRCHSAKAWRPAPGFSHSQTSYPLVGKHQAVACVRCHPPQNDTETPASAFPAPKERTYAQYSEIPHDSCLDCHQDPHAGKFGEKCDSCHTPVDWRRVQSTQASNLAFHEKTRYPLRGEHVRVPCVACHGPWPGHPAQFKHMRFAACTDCHLDAHEGQLAKPKCERCHTVEGFSPARFEVEDHARTRYPLEGAHRAVPCAICHPSEPKVEARLTNAVRALVRRKSMLAPNIGPILSSVAFTHEGNLNLCDTCHRDPHAGQFRDAKGSNVPCTTCHTMASFSQLKFDHDRDTRFALTGKHKETLCESCHRPTTLRGEPSVAYAGVSMVCSSCHADVHAGQFTKASGAPMPCTTCHDTQAFKPVDKFRHQPPFTNFVLDGKHASTACKNCHPSVHVAGGAQVRRYRGVPTTCIGCHVDVHGKRFEGLLP